MSHKSAPPLPSARSASISARIASILSVSINAGRSFGNSNARALNLSAGDTRALQHYLGHKNIQHYPRDAYVFVSERGGPMSPIGFHRLIQRTPPNRGVAYAALAFRHRGSDVRWQSRS